MSEECKLYAILAVNESKGATAGDLKFSCEKKLHGHAEWRILDILSREGFGEKWSKWIRAFKFCIDVANPVNEVMSHDK